MEQILGPLFFTVIIAMAVFFSISIFGKSRNLIREWAARNGYRIIHIEQRILRRGPFLWTTSKGQTVYYVTVRTPQGIMNAYVRCGSFLLGLLSDNIDVRWD